MNDSAYRSTADFIRDLRGSRCAVFAVAEWIHARGWSVDIPAIQETPTAEARAAYADEGDIFAYGRAPRRRIEVKNPRGLFTGPADWPWPHVFVASKEAADREGGSAAAYFIVNAGLTHAAVIHRRTREDWYVVSTAASNRGGTYPVYACPIELVEFVSLLGEAA
jgi:hypothetical protein